MGKELRPRSSDWKDMPELKNMNYLADGKRDSQPPSHSCIMTPGRSCKALRSGASAWSWGRVTQKVKLR